MQLKVGKTRLEVFVYTTIWKRFKGFMFQKKPIQNGICFPKCNSIHTFFMRQPIDIVMTDRDHHIIRLYSALKPWRIIFPQKRVYYTYELPCGTIQSLKEKQTLTLSE